MTINDLTRHCAEFYNNSQKGFGAVRLSAKNYDALYLSFGGSYNRPGPPHREVPTLDFHFQGYIFKIYAMLSGIPNDAIEFIDLRGHIHSVHLTPAPLNTQTERKKEKLVSMYKWFNPDEDKFKDLME